MGTADVRSVGRGQVPYFTEILKANHVMKYVVALVDSGGEARHLTQLSDHPGDIARMMKEEDLTAKKLEPWQSRIASIDTRSKRVRVWAEAHDMNVEGIGMDALSVLYQHNRKAQMIERWRTRQTQNQQVIS